VGPLYNKGACMRTMAVREYRSTGAALGRTGQQRGVRFCTL